MQEEKKNPVSLKNQAAKVAILTLTALPFMGVVSTYGADTNVSHPVANFGLLPGETKTIDLKSVFADVYGTIGYFSFARSDVCSPCVSSAGWADPASTLVSFGALGPNNIGSTAVTLDAVVRGFTSDNSQIAENNFKFQVGHAVAQNPFQKITLHGGSGLLLQPENLFRSDNPSAVMSYTVSYASGRLSHTYETGGIFIKSQNNPGTTTVTLQASVTNSTYTAAAQYEITVAPNTPPEQIPNTVIPDQYIKDGESVMIKLSDYFSDLNGDPLSVIPASGAIADVSSTRIGGVDYLILNGKNPGTTTIPVRISDSHTGEIVRDIGVRVGKRVIQKGTQIEYGTDQPGTALLVNGNESVTNETLGGFLGNPAYKQTGLTSTAGINLGTPLETADLPAGHYILYHIQPGSGATYNMMESFHYQIIDANLNPDSRIDIQDIVKNQTPSDVNGDGRLDKNDWSSLLNLIQPDNFQSIDKLQFFYNFL